MSHQERFAKFVRPEGECLVWTGFVHPSGYGRFQMDGRSHQAHRIAWEFANGPIPEGQEIDHLCRNRRCVNPKHLEAVSHRENVLRGVSPPAVSARQTHCIHGHAFTPENTIRMRNGRQCKTCHNATVSRYWFKTKAARTAIAEV